MTTGTEGLEIPGVIGAALGARGDAMGGEVVLAGGFPVLDEDFQTSLAGLYVPGFPSTRDFGPFFGFVAGATTTAAMIGAALER